MVSVNNYDLFLQQNKNMSSKLDFRIFLAKFLMLTYIKKNKIIIFTLNIYFSTCSSTDGGTFARTDASTCNDTCATFMASRNSQVAELSGDVQMAKAGGCYPSRTFAAP